MEFQCPVIVQRHSASSCGSPVQNIPLQAERHSGGRQKLFAFPAESAFTFRPECCSESQRNGVQLQTGIAFTFDRIPHPGEGYFGDAGIAVAEHPPLPQGQSLLAIVRWADPGYFAAIRISFLRGRTFGSDQRLDAAHEVIISAEFARQYFPNEDPIGKHLITLGHQSYEVVGIVGDTRSELAQQPEPTMYVPIDSGMDGSAALVIRAAHDPDSLALPIQKTIQQIDRALAVSDVLTMNQIINKSSLDADFEVTLLVTF